MIDEKELKKDIAEVRDMLITTSGYTVAYCKERNRELRKIKKNDKDADVHFFNETPRVCLENCRIILQNDPRFKNRLCFNKIDLRVYKLSPFPWDHNEDMVKMPGVCSKFGMYLFNDKKDVSEIRRLIQRDYKQNLNEIKESIYAEAGMHSIHPVKEILNALEWDGVERIKNLMPKYLGVENDDYQANALKLIMLTLITRIDKPGEKMDCVLSLGGKQGTGKSTFCRMLAFNDLSLFTDRLGDLTSKDTMQLVAGKLFIELAEMLALKKTKDIESTKSFISAQQDTYRPPYGATWEDHLRQCVLLATTNENEYLGDLTGDRRWLTVECDPDKREKDISLDLDAEDEFMLAWAEAYHIYKTEHPNIMELALSLAPEAKKHAEMHKEQDPKIGMIEDYLDRLRVEMDKPRVCTVQIQREVFHEFDTNRWKNKDISKIMDNCFPEWHRMSTKQRCGEYGIQISWESDHKELAGPECDNIDTHRAFFNRTDDNIDGYDADRDELNTYANY